MWEIDKLRQEFLERPATLGEILDAYAAQEDVPLVRGNPASLTLDGMLYVSDLRRGASLA